MNAEEIAKRAEARKEKEMRTARRDDERAGRQIERARATGSRLELIRDDDGSELRIRPRRFLAALGGFERVSFIGLFPLCIPCIVLTGLAYDPARENVSMVFIILTALYLFMLFQTARWFVGMSPLRIRVTPKGHVALWHRSGRPDRPTWVGPRESFRVRLDAFDRRHIKTGWVERRHGWTEIRFELPGKPLRYAGPAYFLNADDEDVARNFLQQYGILS